MRRIVTIIGGIAASLALAACGGGESGGPRTLNFYTFTAEFIPDRGSGDRRSINNVA